MVSIVPYESPPLWTIHPRGGSMNQDDPWNPLKSHVVLVLDGLNWLNQGKQPEPLLLGTQQKCWSTLPSVSKIQLCRYLVVHPKFENKNRNRWPAVVHPYFTGLITLNLCGSTNLCCRSPRVSVSTAFSPSVASSAIHDESIQWLSVQPLLWFNVTAQWSSHGRKSKRCESQITERLRECAAETRSLWQRWLSSVFFCRFCKRFHCCVSMSNWLSMIFSHEIPELLQSEQICVCISNFRCFTSQHDTAWVFGQARIETFVDSTAPAALGPCKFWRHAMRSVDMAWENAVTVGQRPCFKHPSGAAMQLRIIRASNSSPIWEHLPRHSMTKK